MSKIVHSEEALREIINSLPVAVVIIDSDRKIALVNKITEEFAKRPAAEIIGKTGGDAFGCIYQEEVGKECGQDEMCKTCGLRNTVIATMKQQKSQEMIEIVMDFSTGVRKDLRVSTRYINLNDEEVVLLSIEDITDIKKREEEKLKQVQLTTAMETVGGISHELAQPLMAVLGYADLILEDLKEDNPLFKYITAISHNSKRLGGLVNDLQRITSYKSKNYLGSNNKIIDVKASAEGE